MVEPVESLTKQLVQRITDPFGLAILAGVTSSSFWFFGNFGMALDGIVPAVSTEKERGKKDVTDVSALRLWEWFYNRGKKHFGVVALLGGTSYLVASTFRPDLRPILYGASFFLYSVIPYTLIVLKPINDDMLKTASDVAGAEVVKRPETARVDKLFSEWEKYHCIRMAIGAVSWGLGVAALLLA